MITASSALLELLNGGNQFVMADLYTFSLTNGITLRYTTADKDLSIEGNLFDSTGLFINRNTLKVNLGIEVDTLDLTVAFDERIICNGMTFPQLISKGIFDRALVRLERAFLQNWNSQVVDRVTQYLGWVADTEGSRNQISIKVKSILELLNIKMPRNIMQASCSNTLYDDCCGLKKDSWSISGMTQNGSTASLINVGGVGKPDAYFDLGVIEYISGVNSGLKRTIRKYANNQILVILPFPNMPGTGDNFKVYPGCDKTKATCQNKFNNLKSFRGCPFLPVPEVMY